MYMKVFIVARRPIRQLLSCWGMIMMPDEAIYCRRSIKIAIGPAKGMSCDKTDRL